MIKVRVRYEFLVAADDQDMQGERCPTARMDGCTPVECFVCNVFPAFGVWVLEWHVWLGKRKNEQCRFFARVVGKSEFRTP